MARADWPADLPQMTVKPAFDAKCSVLWAMDTRGGSRLVPYPLEVAEVAREAAGRHSSPRQVERDRSREAP